VNAVNERIGPLRSRDADRWINVIRNMLVDASQSGQTVNFDVGADEVGDGKTLTIRVNPSGEDQKTPVSFAKLYLAILELQRFLRLHPKMQYASFIVTFRNGGIASVDKGFAGPPGEFGFSEIVSLAVDPHEFG
jgi:hypothetical protein